MDVSLSHSVISNPLPAPAHDTYRIDPRNGNGDEDLSGQRRLIVGRDIYLYDITVTNPCKACNRTVTDSKTLIDCMSTCGHQRTKIERERARDTDIYTCH